MQAELLSQHSFSNLQHCQSCFDDWRDVYNLERPHEALQMQPPISRYLLSPTPFPENLPPILYDTNDIIRKVDDTGKIFFRNRTFRVGKAFSHNLVAVRPGLQDGGYDVFFCQTRIAQIDLRADNKC